MIPEEHKSAIITNGMHFMRSITECYGAEKGMELWETIANTLDPEVKGQIFFAMITGTYNNRVHLKGLSTNNNGVACIKEIRTWTGLGLKDSKDIYDRMRNHDHIANGTPTEFLTVNHEDYHKAVSGLRNVGFMV